MRLEHFFDGVVPTRRVEPWRGKINLSWFLDCSLTVPLQIIRFEMSPLVDDAVNDESVAHHFVHDAIGIHADLAHVVFANFRNDPAEMWQLNSVLTSSAIS